MYWSKAREGKRGKMPKTARRGVCVVARGGKVDQSPDNGSFREREYYHHVGMAIMPCFKGPAVAGSMQH